MAQAGVRLCGLAGLSCAGGQQQHMGLGRLPCCDDERAPWLVQKRGFVQQLKKKNTLDATS